MALLTLEDPEIEPVSLDEVKLYLRVDFDEDNDLISGLITAARRWAETYTRRRFITQTMRLLMDFFPGYVDMKLAGQKVSSPFVSGSNAVLVGIRYAIVLPLPPVQSIVAFNYQDQNGTNVAMLASDNYIQDLSSQPARLMPLFGQMWPVARVVANAVQVDYKVGYGDDALKVPDGIRAAIKLLATYWYTNRVPDDNDIPMAVKVLLYPYRDLRF